VSVPGPARLASRGLLAALCAALGLAGPAARAEEGLGRFSWRPSLRLTTVADSNVFYEDHDRDGSIGFWVAPRLQLDYRTPAVEFGADLGVDLRRYIEHGSELAAELYRAVGWAEVGLHPGLTLRVSNAFVPQPVRLGLPEDEASNLVQTNRVDADLRWWRELPHGRQLKAGLLASYFLSEDYAEAIPVSGGGFVVDDDFRADYAQGLGFIELQSPMGERSSAYLRGQASYREFTEFSDADHSNLSLLLGMRSNRWPNLDLEIAGGIGALGFDGFADALRGLARASARYRLPSGWILSLAGRYLLTPNLVGDDVTESTGELGVEKRFGVATAASLRLFVTRFKADVPDDAVNLFGAAELRFRRQLARRLQLLVSYRHWLNRGDFELDDFSQNRLALEFSFRL
jgi:hypothetical protein